MKQNITVGIDIGTSITRVVVCNQEASNTLPLILGVGTAETRGLRHGYVTEREDATATIRKAIKIAEAQANIKIKEADIAIGGIGLSSEYATGAAITTRADGVISSFDVEKAISEAENSLDLKNKTILHAYPVSFKVDGKELSGRPDGIYGLKLEVKTLFILCFSQHLDDLLDVVQNAGVRVRNYVATPLATQNLLLTDIQKNFGCVLIDIGAETVSVSVFENNTPTSIHVFGIGSLDITKDIALGLRITPEEAESVKLGVVSFQQVPKKKLDEIIEARLSDIFELIDKYLKKIGRSGLLPAGAIIVGGGSQMAMIESVAKTMLKIPVRLGAVEIPSVKGGIKDQRLLVAYATAVGNRAKQQGGKKRPNPSGSDEGIISTIKDFFKQLMP